MLAHRFRDQARRVFEHSLVGAAADADFTHFEHDRRRERRDVRQVAVNELAFHAP